MNMIEKILEFIGTDNDFFKGGLLLALLGFATAQLRRLPMLVLQYIQTRLVHTLRIDSQEHRLFDAFVQLLNTPEAKVQTRTYRLVLEHDETKGNRIDKLFNASFFRFFYKGYTYYVDFEENEPENARMQSYFVYRIWSYWRAKAAIECLLAFLEVQVAEKPEDVLEVYHRQEHSFHRTTLGKRPMESLYFDSRVLDELLADVHNFIQSEGWYRRLGIPYRRGYLLYGEPGTGKTSLIKGIASLLDKPLYIIGQQAFDLNSTMTSAFQDIPAGSMVVLEDFDRLFMKTKASLKPSMGTLLNQLDGLEAKEGMMIFITANHRSVFDAALERPGRIDRKFYIGYMGWASACKMFINFYGDEYLQQFESVWLDGMYSPAQLQVYFSKYKHDPKTAVQNFPRMLEEIGETGKGLGEASRV